MFSAIVSFYVNLYQNILLMFFQLFKKKNYLNLKAWGFFSDMQVFW